MPHHRRINPGQYGSRLGEAVPDRIREPSLQQEQFDGRIEFRPADTEEADTAAEQLCKAPAGNPVQEPASPIGFVKCCHQPVAGYLR